MPIDADDLTLTLFSMFNTFDTCANYGYCIAKDFHGKTSEAIVTIVDNTLKKMKADRIDHRFFK